MRKTENINSAAFIKKKISFTNMKKNYSSQKEKKGFLQWFIIQKFMLRGFLATSFYLMRNLPWNIGI